VVQEEVEEGVKPVATTAVCYQQEASHSGPGANANSVYVCMCVCVCLC